MSHGATAPSFRILSAGDAALVVELPERIDPELNAWCISLARALGVRLGTSVRDVVIGYCSVTVYFDPLHVDAAWLEGEVRASAGSVDAETAAEGALVEVPVCYGGDLGPDLAELAAFAASSEDEVIAASRRPRVPCLHGRLRSRLRLHGRGRCEDRRAATSVAADGRADGVGCHRRRADRHLSGRHARWMEHRRPHADSALRSGPSGAVPVQVR